jgi:hypothetical protein
MAKKTKVAPEAAVAATNEAAAPAKPVKPPKASFFLRRADGMEFPWNARPAKRMEKMKSPEAATVDGEPVEAYRTANTAWSGAANADKRLHRVWFALPNRGAGFIVGNYGEVVSLEGGFSVVEGKANRADPKPIPAATLDLEARAAKYAATMAGRKPATETVEPVAEAAAE